MSLHIGVVGAGRTGSRLARILSTYDDVQVTAVAEPNRPSRDSFSKTFSTKLAVSDHKRLASDSLVDVVYVCSPPTTHNTVAVDCLKAGKDVICMPPMAITVSQADEMISAAEQYGRRLLIALPQRYNPINQETARLIDAGKIGYPFMALASFIENEYNRLNDWHDWLGTWDVGGGGILMERGSEMIDLLHFFFGQVDGVSAVCTRFAIEALNKAEDTCLVDLEFVEELSAQLALTGAAQYSADSDQYPGSIFRMQVFGVEGSISLAGNEDALVLSTKKNKHQVIPLSEIRTGLPSDMNRDLIDAIIEDREPLVTTEQAREALVVVVAAYKSSQMKRRVETLEQL